LQMSGRRCLECRNGSKGGAAEAAVEEEEAVVVPPDDDDDDGGAAVARGPLIVDASIAAEGRVLICCEEACVDNGDAADPDEDSMLPTPIERPTDALRRIANVEADRIDQATVSDE
jgi:hypothetical protein